MTDATATKQPERKPAVSSRELVERLGKLAAAPVHPTSLILKALRVPDVSPWYDEDVPAIAAALRTIDPDWSARLGIVERVLPARRSAFAALLVEAIVTESRRTSDYPVTDGSATPDLARIYGEWAAAQLSRVTDPLPGALVLTALWPDRRARWFPEVAVVMLKAWAAGAKQARRDPLPGIVARVFANQKTGRNRALEFATVLAQSLALLEEAIRQRRESEFAAERARDARYQAEEALRGTRAELTTTREELAAADARASEAIAEAASTRERSAMELLGARTDAANEIAGVRAKTLRVLRHEVEQIRLYLDRSNPNAAEALARLAYIDELRSELEKEGKR